MESLKSPKIFSKLDESSSNKGSQAKNLPPIRPTEFKEDLSALQNLILPGSINLSPDRKKELESEVLELKRKSSRVFTIEKDESYLPL